MHFIDLDYKNIKLIQEMIEQTLPQYGLYKNLILEYDKVIKKYIEMLYKLNKTNLIDIQATTQFLLVNGYFSKKHKYFYRGNCDYSIVDNLLYQGVSPTICSGYGVCRHNAAFLNYILTKMGFDSHVVSMKLKPTSRVERLENSGVYLGDVKSLNKVEALIEKIRLYNHAIVVTLYNDHIYFFDNTNGFFYDRYGKRLIYCDNKSVKMKSNFNKRFKDIGNYNILLKSELYNTYNEYMKKNIQDNLPIFDQFYEENKATYKKIDNKIRVLKKG